MTHDATAILPGDPWTPELAARFILSYDRDVSAEVARLRDEMGRHGQLYVHRYDVEMILRLTPRRTMDAQPLAHVQVRLVSGTIHSATVSVLWADGGVIVRGWPLDEGSGWVVR
jgi:hypothetical protein